jgi:3-oxoadipate enol-lactonase
MNRSADFWQIHGAAHGPWLTLCHPIGSDRHIWDALLPTLAPHYRLLSYDLRGHGQTQAEPAASWDELAADCEALWQSLGITQSHFVGLSLGGCVGLALARRAPQRVQSLSVACSRLDADEASARLWQDRADQVLAQGMAPIVDATLARWLSPGFAASHPEAVARIRATLDATPAAGFAACARLLAQGQPLESLSALTMPVLYLAGRGDLAVPVEHLRRYQTHTPGARLVELDGPHLLPLENPQEFGAALRSFLGP